MNFKKGWLADSHGCCAGYSVCWQWFSHKVCKALFLSHNLKLGWADNFLPKPNSWSSVRKTPQIWSNFSPTKLQLRTLRGRPLPTTAAVRSVSRRLAPLQPDSGPSSTHKICQSAAKSESNVAGPLLAFKVHWPSTMLMLIQHTSKFEFKSQIDFNWPSPLNVTMISFAFWPQWIFTRVDDMKRAVGGEQWLAIPRKFAKCSEFSDSRKISQIARNQLSRSLCKRHAKSSATQT